MQILVNSDKHIVLHRKLSNFVNSEATVFLTGSIQISHMWRPI